MARKRKPEDIIGKLREAEIVLAQGGTVADACRNQSLEGPTTSRSSIFAESCFTASISTPTRLP